jgi:nicotinamide-nucleotide amidase
MWFEQKGCYWMSMPGVPHEMKKLVKDFVLPKLSQVFDLPVIYHKLIKTAGIGESWLADLIKDWENALPSHIRLAYLPSLGHVKLRLTAFGEDKKVLAAAVEQQIQHILPTISNYVYGYNEETLETAVGKLLKNSGKTLALAESCSGGYISHLITTVPGSSNYLRGTVVPYHNDLKQQVLGVNSATLAQHGAVSEETVREMATGVKKLFGADYGLASSGIAGPDGGSPDKPVGTVWIACAGPDFVEAKLLQLTQDRLINIQLTGVAVLNLLRICFLKHNK